MSHPSRARGSHASPSTSWQKVAPWYNKLVGSEGQYYHQHVVLPGSIKLLDLQPTSNLLDLGCGQGILARSVPEVSHYLGLDTSATLIEEARKLNKNEKYLFQVRNVARTILGAQSTFTHAAIILALQNMSDPAIALENAAKYLVKGGTLLIVLNHPCFRIPRQSGWGIDEQTKIQYRWINRYNSPLKIPITTHPGQSDSGVTWSFHFSLHEYMQMLRKTGFAITNLEEWSSDKESVGKAAKMENRSRSEFPLFLALVCKKQID